MYKENSEHGYTAMAGIAAILKEPEGLRYNGGAVLDVLIAYLLGLGGLFHPAWPVNLIATLVLAHAMTIAAYLIHDCGHNLVFKRSKYNAHLGHFMSWICGAAYGTYEDMRYKHFRHHVDNDDVVWFEYEKYFEKHPPALKITQFLEWFYIPAHDLIMHFIMAFRVIPLSSQLKLYHRNRILRICNPQPDDYPKGAEYLRSAQTAKGAIGGNAASFLTSF